jgi:hypothetical protein
MVHQVGGQLEARAFSVGNRGIEKAFGIPGANQPRYEKAA